MKTNYLLPILFIAHLIFTSQQVLAQQEITVLDSTVDGTIKFAWVKNLDTKSLIPEESKAFLNRVLKTGKGNGFYLYKVETDELGMIHEKYQQTFNGIKVEFSEFIVHKDKSGSIVSINGDFARIPESFNLKT